MVAPRTPQPEALEAAVVSRHPALARSPVARPRRVKDTLAALVKDLEWAVAVALGPWVKTPMWRAQTLAAAVVLASQAQLLDLRLRELVVAVVRAGVRIMPPEGPAVAALAELSRHRPAARRAQSILAAVVAAHGLQTAELAGLAW